MKVFPSNSAASLLASVRPFLLSGFALMLVWFTEARAARVTVNGFKYSDPAFESRIEVDLEGIAGVTGVDATAADGTAVSLTADGPDRYRAVLGPYANFLPFLAATGGTWELRIHFGASGTAVYAFPVSGFGTPAGPDPFPPAPTMISPTDGATGVAQRPTFRWNSGGMHTGVLEALFVNVFSLADPAIGEFANSFGSLGLNDTMWTPSLTLPAGGAASFLVQYETNQSEDSRVGVPVFDSASSTVGDPGIPWDQHSGDLFSRDLITFTVPPLEIVSIVRNAAEVEIEIAAPPDMRVRIEYSPDLSVGSWISLGNVSMSGGRGTFVDTDAGRVGLALGFYRAVEVPAPPG